MKMRLFNEMLSVGKYMAIAMFVMGMATSCSDDDEDGGGSTELYVPASVVDGVRVQGISTSDYEHALSIDYNADGTPDKATVGGTEFDFEYDGTRAALSTGRKLVRIVSHWSDDDNKESITHSATNFVINTDGFVTKYVETVEDNGEGYGGKAVVNVSISYNANGRISRIVLSGSETGWDEVDGNYSERIGTTINYTYNGGALEKSGFTDEGETVTYTYDYDKAPTNTYNLVTPQLAQGMAVFSPVAYLLANLHMLGYGSSQLPTKMTYHEYSNYTDGDPDYDNTNVTDISYTLWDDNRVKEIKTSSQQYGLMFTYSLTYLVSDAATEE